MATAGPCKDTPEPVAVPPVFGIAGRRNSGKTTLMVALVRDLTRQGFRVATIKQAGQSMRAGPDHAERCLAFGAREASIVTPAGQLLAGTVRGSADPLALASRFLAKRADVVLVEGARSPGVFRIEVWRAATGRCPLWPEDPAILAVATDSPLSDCALPQLDLNHVPPITRFLLNATGLARQPHEHGQQSGQGRL